MDFAFESGCDADTKIKSNFPIGNPKVQLVQGAGFEPAKRLTADLESAPFDHSGTPA